MADCNSACSSENVTKWSLLSWLKTVTIGKNDTFYSVWLWLISAAFLYNILFIPIRSSFSQLNFDYLVMWFYIDYAVCDLAYVADMAIKARTRYFVHGIEVYDTADLAKTYLKSREFVIDVLSILPTDLIYLAVGPAYVIVRLNRFLRLPRFQEMITHVESTANFPNVFRFATTVFYVVIAIHYTSIFYHSYSKSIGYSNNDTEFGIAKHWANTSFITIYSRSLFWGFMTFVFIGEQPVPKTPLQHIIYCIFWILGLTMFGFIIGRIGEILRNMSFTREAFSGKLDAVRAYLTVQNIPHDMSEKVLSWLTYADEISALSDSDMALSVLPDKLLTEIAMDLHLADLKKVKLFGELEESALTELVRRFKLQVYSPLEYVCKKGDIGREMYVVKSGVLQVVSDDGSKVFVTLGPGTAFGEISLLSIPGSRTGNRRTANVRSKGFCSLFSLSKEDLYAVLEDYPGAMQKLVDKGTEILRKEKKIDEELVSRKEEVERILEERMQTMKMNLASAESSIAYLISSMKKSNLNAHQRLNYIQRLILKRYGSIEEKRAEVQEDEREFHSDSEADMEITWKSKRKRFVKSAVPSSHQREQHQEQREKEEKPSDALPEPSEETKTWSLASTVDTEDTVEPKNLLLPRAQTEYRISIKLTPASPTVSIASDTQSKT